MTKKAIAALIVIVAVIGAVALLVHKPAPAAVEPEEFKTVDAMLNELDEYMNFENQELDDNLVGIWEEW